MLKKENQFRQTLIQNSYINELNKYIEYSNQIQAKIANYDKKSQQSINKKAQIAIQPILEKIADLRKENDAKMKQILTQHAQDIRANRTEIYYFETRNIT